METVTKGQDKEMASCKTLIKTHHRPRNAVIKPTDLKHRCYTKS